MALYKNTVTDLLWDVLSKLMVIEELNSFRLVGGTSLSLLLGHRKSIDIDFFTDAEYGSIDFNTIDRILMDTFGYVELSYEGNNGLGKSYFIGSGKENNIKIDMFYTDVFVFPIKIIENIRLSQLQEIIAMKLEVIGHNGRKKDFWDIHELLEHYILSDMLYFYEKRYPYSYSRNKIIEKLSDFDAAEIDFDPICFRGKYWELIKLDIIEEVRNHDR